jgi:hypothetical protein
MGKRELASALLREHAAEFKVDVNTIWVAMRRTGFVKKQTSFLEHSTMKRMAYLRRLGRLVEKYGCENIIYVDESGFKKHSYRRHAWTRRGQIIYGDVSGNNRKATNLNYGAKRRVFDTIKKSANFLLQTLPSSTSLNRPIVIRNNYLWVCVLFFLPFWCSKL